MGGERPSIFTPILYWMGWTKMKVKLMKTYASPEGCYSAGSVIELKEKDARELVKSGQAEAVVEEVEKQEAVETTEAVVEEVETADATPRRRGGRR